MSEASRWRGKRVVATVNAAAGFFQNNSEAENRLGDILRAHFPGIEVLWLSPDRIAPEVRRAIQNGADLVLVAGGDGTTNAVANLLAGADVALGVLPGGTFNYVAKDMGVPEPMETAVEALAEGMIRPVDLSEVNGRFFLHNAALGIHPHAVERRERYREEWGIGKAIAVTYALLEAIWNPPLLEGHLHSRERAEFIRAPFVFVGNNTYETAPFAFIQRKSLNDGQLSVFYAQRVPPATLFLMAFRTLLKRRLKEVPELERIQTRSMTIDSRKKKLKVLLDGELIRMKPPLEFRVRPGLLRALIPPAARKPPAAADVG
ncbi:MAG: diacylglycerol/lipid kinase family protein [Desulfococcaceae bacterium]